MVQHPDKQPIGVRPALHPLAVMGLVIALVAVSQFALLEWEINPTRTARGWHDNLWGTDAYARLLRVEQLHETGGWYDPVLRRFNAPYGLPMHWTRPLDGLLYTGAWVGSFGTGFHAALHAWALVLPPLLAVVSLLVLYWGSRPFLSSTGFVCAAVLFVLQQGTTYEFAIGNADHHALLLTATALSLAAMLRYLHDAAPRILSVAAFSSGLALWITPEGLLVMLPLLAALGLLWMSGRFADPTPVLRYCLYFCITIWTALLIERVPSFTAVEYDRLSIVHAVLATLMLAGAGLLHIASRFVRCREAWQRMVLGAAIVIVIAVLVWRWFPGIVQHPFDHVEPYVRRVLLDWISMERTLWPRDTASIFEFLFFAVPGIVAAVYCVMVLVAGPESKRPRHLLYLLGLVIYIPYSLSAARGIMLLHIWVVMPWAELIIVLLRRAVMAYRISAVTTSVLAVLSTFLVFTGHGLLAFGFASAVSAKVNFKLTPACDFGAIAHYLESEYVADGQAVLTNMADAPEIAYRTSFAVVNAPYHRNASGIRDGFAALLGANEARAREVFLRRGITHVLWCRDVPGMWKRVFRSAPHAVLTRLFTFRSPDWLRPVPLPPELARKFVFYRLVQSH